MLHLHEKKIIYYSGGFIIILFLVIVLVIYPNVKEILEINRQITKLRNDLELKFERSRHVNRPQGNIATAKKIIEANELIFARPGAEFNLINDLDQIAASLSLKQEIDLDSKENLINDDVYFLNLNIRATGNLSNLMTYLNKLEKMNMVVAMTDFNLSKADAAAGVTIKGKIYVKK